MPKTERKNVKIQCLLTINLDTRLKEHKAYYRLGHTEQSTIEQPKSSNYITRHTSSCLSSTLPYQALP